MPNEIVRVYQFQVLEFSIDINLQLLSLPRSNVQREKTRRLAPRSERTTPSSVENFAPPELQKMWEGIGCYKDVARTELGSTMQ